MLLVLSLVSSCVLTLLVYLAMSAATSAEAGGVRKSPARTELEAPGKGSLCWTAGKKKTKKTTKSNFRKIAHYLFTWHTECAYTALPNLIPVASFQVVNSVHKESQQETQLSQVALNGPY